MLLLLDAAVLRFAAFVPLTLLQEQCAATHARRLLDGQRAREGYYPHRRCTRGSGGREISCVGRECDSGFLRALVFLAESKRDINLGEQLTPLKKNAIWLEEWLGPESNGYLLRFIFNVYTTDRWGRADRPPPNQYEYSLSSEHLQKLLRGAEKGIQLSNLKLRMQARPSATEPISTYLHSWLFTKKHALKTVNPPTNFVPPMNVDSDKAMALNAVSGMFYHSPHVPWRNEVDEKKHSLTARLWLGPESNGPFPQPTGTTNAGTDPLLPSRYPLNCLARYPPIRPASDGVQFEGKNSSVLPYDTSQHQRIIAPSDNTDLRDSGAAPMLRLYGPSYDHNPRPQLYCQPQRNEDWARGLDPVGAASGPATDWRPLLLLPASGTPGQNSQHNFPWNYHHPMTNITGGTFIGGNVTHIRHHGEAGLHILHRATAGDALHASAERYPQPQCHPNTRTKLLEVLSEWAHTMKPVKTRPIGRFRDWPTLSDEPPRSHTQ
ncbi:hypothetical protein B0H16DRAFT_1475329 [Mycena metata]|uniref:Uncharacterized protein n=1 Tax=Mycena metata TaxID=1033252 RepID=A0AAD7HEL1_9AGAR|nr:hypothetical protein B0H16DRAFT_1475329 [Mycena metata]